MISILDGSDHLLEENFHLRRWASGLIQEAYFKMPYHSVYYVENILEFRQIIIVAFVMV